MLEKENELRDILRQLEQLNKEAYRLAEDRNGIKLERVEKRVQLEKARGMTVRAGAFAALTAVGIAITMLALQTL